jgi:hypothetical protein
MTLAKPNSPEDAKPTADLSIDRFCENCRRLRPFWFTDNKIESKLSLGCEVCGWELQDLNVPTLRQRVIHTRTVQQGIRLGASVQALPLKTRVKLQRAQGRGGMPGLDKFLQEEYRNIKREGEDE